MQADLTRNTFDHRNHFSRVLMQQGRVQLDSDWNEQVSILLHYERMLASDVMGSYGGPEDDIGFEIIADINRLPEEEQRSFGGLDDDDFVISKGRYYVDGTLCENESYVKYTAQPNFPDPDPPRNRPYLVYLDVWERHITANEDPNIREVALGGTDTATRAKVVWQVKVAVVPDKSQEKKAAAKAVADAAEDEVTDNPAATKQSVGNAARSRADAIKGAAEVVAKAADDEIANNPAADKDTVKNAARSKAEEIKVEANRSQEEKKAAEAVAKAAEYEVTDNPAADKDTVKQKAREKVDEIKSAPEAVAKAAEYEVTDNPAADKDTVKQKAREKAEEIDWFRLDRDTVWKNWREGWVPHLQSVNRGMLKAQLDERPDADGDSSTISSEARYRGVENQLYRVEIHTDREADDGPSFKWSRDNGSVAFAISKMEGNVVTLKGLGRDDHLSLKPKDLVEIVDDDYVLQGSAEPLLRVKTVDSVGMKVTLDGQLPRDVGQHPLLRRWDHGASDSQNGLTSCNTIPLKEDTPLPLEDGVQILFQSASVQGGGNQSVYRTGDYWLIPTRTANGKIQWPTDKDSQPKARRPHGIDHHYAPLAIINNGEPIDCRRHFKFRDLERRVSELEKHYSALKELPDKVQFLEHRVGVLWELPRWRKWQIVLIIVLDVLLIAFLIWALIILL